jgi:type I restriction enzyme S subunit
VVNGGTPKTGVPAYWDGSIRWITPAEMGKRDTPFIAETKRNITHEGVRDSSATLLPPYSVILSSRAPIGHLAINTEMMATNQGCKGLIPKQRLSYKYLYYYLLSIIDLLNELGSGTTFKELSGSKLKEVQIPIAPMLEQKRIVAILDEAFEKIATTLAQTKANIYNLSSLFNSTLSSVLQANEPLKRLTIADVAVVFDAHMPRRRQWSKGLSFSASVPCKTER